MISGNCKKVTLKSSNSKSTPCSPLDNVLGTVDNRTLGRKISLTSGPTSSSHHTEKSGPSGKISWNVGYNYTKLGILIIQLQQYPALFFLCYILLSLKFANLMPILATLRTQGANRRDPRPSTDGGIPKGGLYMDSLNKWVEDNDRDYYTTDVCLPDPPKINMAGFQGWFPWVA